LISPSGREFPRRILARRRAPFSLTVFGCIELKMELNWTRNSKSKIETNCLIIQILLFGCAQNLLFESKDVPNSKSCLDVQTWNFMYF
jgi:hypothetical protein